MALGTGRSRATPTRRQTVRCVALLVGLSLCGAACAATARPTGEWVKTRDSAESLESARQVCKQQALAEVAAATDSPIAASAGAGSFFKCMANKGWVQAAKATPTPGY